jgi:hypothetical protein
MKEGDAVVELTDELRSLVDEIEASYWVPILKTPLSSLDEFQSEAKEDCPALYESIAAFNFNLRAAKDLLEFPYLLLVPLLPELNGKLKKVRESRCAASADGAVGIGVSDGERDAALELVGETLKQSKQHLDRKGLELQRLMHQACLLIWSAVETYSKQVFVDSLNEKPSLLSAIYKSPQLKERFAISNSSWPALLEAHGYNFQGKLGTIIAGDRDFSSPQLLRDLFPVMFAGISNFGFPPEIFQSDALWILGQRRHLIAHRCGIVDQDYLDKTKDTTQKLGALLQLRGKDVAESMAAAAGYAICLYGNARYCWPRPEI